MPTGELGPGEAGRRAKTRMRIREGRSHRWYIDAVNDTPELNKFMPTFAQYEAFGSFESAGQVGDLELQQAEYSENFLDEVYDNLRSLKVGALAAEGSDASAHALIGDLRRSLALVSNNQR